MRWRDSRIVYWLVLGVGAGLGVWLLSLRAARHLSETWFLILHGVGEALIVAALLAATVDFYVKRRLAVEVAQRTVLNVFGVNAPPAYADALRQFCTTERLLTKCTWEVAFENIVPEAVTLKVEFSCEGVNLTGRTLLGWPDKLKLWVLSSFKGESEYLEYYFNCVKAAAPNRTDHFQAEDLKKVRLAATPGAIQEYQLKKLKPQGEIPPGEAYSARLVTRVIRRTADVFPLVPRTPCLSQTIRVRGLDPSKFEIEVWRGDSPVPRARNTSQGVMTYDVDEVVFPGQTTLVVWRPSESA